MVGGSGARGGYKNKEGRGGAGWGWSAVHDVMYTSNYFGIKPSCPSPSPVHPPLNAPLTSVLHVVTQAAPNSQSPVCLYRHFLFGLWCVVCVVCVCVVSVCGVCGVVCVVWCVCVCGVVCVVWCGVWYALMRWLCCVRWCCCLCLTQAHALWSTSSRYNPAITLEPLIVSLHVLPRDPSPSPSPLCCVGCVPTPEPAAAPEGHYYISSELVPHVCGPDGAQGHDHGSGDGNGQQQHCVGHCEGEGKGRGGEGEGRGGERGKRRKIKERNGGYGDECGRCVKCRLAVAV